MHFRSTICIILSVLISACNSGMVKTGDYASYKLSKFKSATLMLSGYAGYSAGMKLHLEEDSTFIYSTCGHILEGNWTDNKNHIFLDIERSFQRVDSIQSYEVPIDSLWFYKDGIVFQKEGKRLWNKRFDFITILKRQD